MPIMLTGFFLLLMSCGKETPSRQYQALVKQELAQGQRMDSLFLGIYLGMPRADFYMHCWELNKKGLFTDGESNTAVLYRITEGLRYEASMNFYPQFHQEKISNIGASFRYDGWAPWNKHMSADSLKQDVLQLYKKWYPGGNPFITIEDKEKGTIYVKVDGNRRIIIGSYDDAYVKMDYTDLFVEEQSKRTKSDG